MASRGPGLRRSARYMIRVGVVLIEMLSGQRPFNGISELAILYNLHFSPPTDLHQLPPDIPDGLARVVRRMLEIEPAARYATMAEVRQELRPFASADSSHVVATGWHRARGEEIDERLHVRRTARPARASPLATGRRIPEAVMGTARTSQSLMSA